VLLLLLASTWPSQASLSHHEEVERLVWLQYGEHRVGDNVCQLLSQVRRQLGGQAGAAHAAQHLCGAHV
jgi:hypothetical protein